MKKIRLLLIQITLVFAMIYGIGTSLSYFLVVFKDYPPAKPDDVVRWESDMEALKKVIPSSETEIGYVSDWDRLGYDKDVYIEFVLTNYAFAPQRLQRGLNYEWVIANSTEDEEFLDWLIPQLSQPYTIESFGKGIYLIHQEGK